MAHAVALRRISALFVLGSVVAAADDAEACAVCGASDSTLPTNGAETPFRGRARATADGRAVGFRSTVGTVRLAEYRGEAGVAYAPTQDLLVGIQVPIIHRQLSTANETTGDVATGQETVPGDVEARLTHLAWSSSSGAVRRRFGALGAIKAPTGPLQRDPEGRYLQPDLQPGCGSVMPVVGLWYSLGQERWSLIGTATLFFPVSVREGPHPGDSLRASITGQLQPLRWFAGRLGLHSRWDSTGDVDGEADLRSGGFAAFVAPELVVSPTTDLVISFGASFPLVQALRGYRTTTPVAMLGVGLDF